MTATLTLSEINALPEAGFVRRFGGVLEHSPDYARRAWAKRPFADGEALAAAFRAAIGADDAAAQLSLIRAHPDLAGKAALAGELSAESAGEQRSAGLDRLNAEEYRRFFQLNRAYHEKFGLPFVVCVREHDRESIFEQAEARLEHTPDEERAAALEQIARIARLRIFDVLGGTV